MLPSRRTRFLLPAALIALAAGCPRVTTPVPGENDVTRILRPGLEQRVTLSPAELTAGDNVTITSVITNHGNQAIPLESRICGLTLAGDIRLDWPPGHGVCGGFSMGGTIAPGESRSSTELRQVTSGPGVYTLRVKHALQPEAWVEMRVVVRGR